VRRAPRAEQTVDGSGHVGVSEGPGDPAALPYPGFVYSTDVDTAVDAEGLLEFLTRTRIGFYQQYPPR
jgi:hypothetical protein